MNAEAPMTRLARPPAPESEGGLANQTMIPVTNAAIAKAPPGRFRAMRQGYVPCDAFERDSLVCATSGGHAARRDEPHDLPVTRDRRAAPPDRCRVRRDRLVRQPLDRDRADGGLPRPG